MGYFPWRRGLFLCLLGCVIASSCVFILSKKFGKPLVTKLFKKSKLDEFAFLKDAKKLEPIVLILFLIPGTPKDMLTYVVGTSPMKITQFLVISTFARIPSVISSTFVGATMEQGKWKTSVLIFVLTTILGIFGIKYRERMMGFCKRIDRKIKGTGHE
ncbi:MAG: TVP38/TMEM64 family protein [Firmicutes bacterium]|nr:TVP38/TMEM64 family protein [Bacillota bacterium]